MNTESGPIGLSSAPSSAPKIVLVAIAVLSVVLAVVLSVIAALVPGVPWWLGIPLGIAAAVVVVVLRVRRSAELLLAGLGAAPADPDRYARFHNIAEGLSLAGGVDEPELYVVDDDARNAAAVAQGNRSAIVASTGLLEALDRISLEGLVAEALVRIRNGDAEASTLGAALFSGLLRGPLAPIGKPAAIVGLRRLLPEDRDLAADRAAVALTRYPPGLLHAFTTIRSGTARVGQPSAATEHIWLVPPSTVGEGGELVVNGVPLEVRIDVLTEL
ncbi:MAG: hypothetical protein OEV40_21290 [Acidimicrobiia bacterium]|nr:hypothetical protein [Acidimicrobiia bacterium]